MQNFKEWFELNETIDDTKKSSLEELLDQIKVDYPFVKVDAHENNYRIELASIQVPHDKRNSGIGSSIIRMIQKYAASVGKPIVLNPFPEPGKKTALDRFYKNLDFVHNKGRNIDYTLSSPISKTMYWRKK